MMTMLARPRRNPRRLFPEITSSLYGTRDSHGATAFLALADTPMSSMRRLLGIGLDGPGQMARLVLLHREAFTAELNGQHVRADFFWEEFYGYLARCWRREPIWKALAAALDGVLPGGAHETARRIFLEEILIDSHCAFYNGRVRSAESVEANDRAFVHSRYLAMLLDMVPSSVEEGKALIAPSLVLQIETHRSAKAWDKAVQVCEAALRRFPEEREFQDRLAELLIVAALSQLRNTQSDADCTADAETLALARAKLEAARKRFPLNQTFYSLLGQCCHIRAVKLANAGSLAAAIAEAHWARTYDPHLAEAPKLEEQLTELMHQMQGHVTKLREELDKRGDVVLNENGHRMVAQAGLGFAPLLEMQVSAEASEISRSGAGARAWGVWRQIGLPEPADPSDSRPEALMEALSGVHAAVPVDVDEIAPAWTAAAASHPELVALDRTAIEKFLAAWLFPESAEKRAPQPESAPPEDAAFVEAAAARPRDTEPPAYWLASRQGLRVKLQALAVTILLAFATGSYFSDRSARAVRDQAFGQLRAAVAAGADERVMQLAETFLGQSLLATDGREDEVREHYDRSFTRWFVSHSHTFDATAHERVERYRTLAAR